MVVKYPRLYENDQFTRIVTPVSLSITQNITPLDTATITLLWGDALPARSYLELFTPNGSAGMFRVRSPHDGYGNETATAELEHMISEVGDWIVKEEISEMLGAETAVRRLFSHYKGGRWVLGSISALGSDLVACEAKYDRVLDTILSVLEQKPDCMMSFDFSVKPWRLNIVKKGTEVTAEGRLSRNVSTASVSYDDSELITRVWYQTFDSKKNATWTHRDAPTLSQYGVVEGTVRTSSDMTAAEIDLMVNTFIREHQHPRISVNIQGNELSRLTGESLDRFSVGKLMRLNLVDYGITVEENITSLTWNDPYTNEHSVSINLGSEEDTVFTFLHNLDSKGSGGGGGGRAKDKQEEQWKEYIVEFEKLDDSVVGMVAKQDETGKILEQAGMTLNSKGLLVYAKTDNGLLHQFDILNDSFTSKIENTAEGLESEIRQTADSITMSVDNKVAGLSSRITQTATEIRSEVTNAVTGLQSSITQESDRISLVVEGTGANAHIKPASIVASINNGQSTIKLSADHIDIDGLVDKLDAKELGCASLEVDGMIDAKGSIYTESYIFTESYVWAESIRVGSQTTGATWKSFTYRYVNLSTERAFLWGSTAGISGSTTGRIPISYTDTTIHYLGR